jgi:hypothetical protein
MSYQKSVLKYLAMILIAVVIGVGSFALTIYIPPDGTIVYNGPWQTDLSVGSAQSGMYMRARVALIGLFALNKSEAVYFIAQNDSQGKLLNSRCDYRIEGGDLPARWWSITVLGWNYFLIPNADNRYSYNWANISRNADKSYVIKLSSQRKAGNWISTGAKEQGRFNLNLRLYRPYPIVLEKPGTISFPRIIREECQ